MQRIILNIRTEPQRLSNAPQYEKGTGSNCGEAVNPVNLSRFYGKFRQEHDTTATEI
jgi:hypothetical protein